MDVTMVCMSVGVVSLMSVCMAVWLVKQIVLAASFMVKAMIREEKENE